ncbi:MAG: ribonuclease D [Pseudomonadota bacterium]
MSAFRLIDHPDALHDLVADWAGAPWIGLDTEFVRERTYHARLCLIQLAGPKGVAVVDPIALRDWSTLFALLDEPGSVKILHAAGQDLELLHQARPERLPTPLFDTQIAAALLGHPPQSGYGALVEKTLGIALPKLHARSDWSRRPLSDAELAYAADDVRHLAALHERLTADLQQQGRLSWAEAEHAALADPARYRIDPERAWLRIGAGRMLTPSGQGALRALAAWRERAAEARDLPRQWLLKDDVLLHWAEHRPDSIAGLTEGITVSPTLLQRHADEWLVAIRDGAAHPPASSPAPYPLPPALEKRLKRLGQVVRSRADDLGLDGAVLAPRRELEALVLGARDTPVLRGWRREVIGEALLAALDDP